MLNVTGFRSCRRRLGCSQGRRALCALFVYSAVSGWEVWYAMCHEQPVSVVTMRMRTFAAISQLGTELSESSPCVLWETLTWVEYILLYHSTLLSLFFCFFCLAQNFISRFWPWNLKRKSNQFCFLTWMNLDATLHVLRLGVKMMKHIMSFFYLCFIALH